MTKHEKNLRSGIAECWQEGPRTLVFEIEGREAAVEYPDKESIEHAKKLIERGPVRIGLGAHGEMLVLCGEEEIVPGIQGELVALIRPDGIGRS